jgi:fibronectin-binding autotransporter adhesin
MAGSTISNLVTNSVTLGGSSYPSPLTITTTGAIEPASTTGDTALIATISGGSVDNQGFVDGGAGASASPGGDGGTGGDGVDLSSGSLTNSGAITGGNGGSYADDAYEGGGTGGTGVVASGATITNAGQISGGSGGDGSSDPAPGGGGSGGDGVSISGGTTFINSGNILAGGAGASAGIGGLYFGPGGVGASVAGSTLTNDGLIAGGFGYDGNGANLTSGSALINDGVIAGGASTTDAYQGATGVSVAGGSSLVNNGTISAGSGGPFEVPYGGVGVDVSGGSVTNSGTIYGGDSLAGSGVGVLFENGGTLIDSGSISGGSESSPAGTSDAVQFMGGDARLIITAGALFTGNVVADPSYSNVLELAAGANSGTAEIGDVLQGFGAITVDPGAVWTINIAAALLISTTITGNDGLSVLALTTAGSFSLGKVSEIRTVRLAPGSSTITVADTTLSGGSVAIFDGASGNNVISAAGDTAASAGKTLTYFAGSGTDGFTGGFETDIVKVSASAVGGDTLTGGSARNTLVLTTAGSFSLAGVSHFATINLAAGNSTGTVSDTTLSGGAIAIVDGASGNNVISATDDTAASTGKSISYFAGSGADSFTGGHENDVIYAGTGLGTFTAGSGRDTFVFMSSNLPNQTLDNYQTNADHITVFGIHAGNGFDLGIDNAQNPMDQTLIDPSIFVANATGSFTSSDQRFAYDTADGRLFYSATGSSGSERLMATFTGAPALSAHDIYFQH